jgi:hypothetical protein
VMSCVDLGHHAPCTNPQDRWRASTAIADHGAPMCLPVRHPSAELVRRSGANCRPSSVPRSVEKLLI